MICCPHPPTFRGAVNAVNGTIKKMQDNGGMGAINRAFKVARAETPSLLDAWRANTLEPMAQQLAG